MRHLESWLVEISLTPPELSDNRGDLDRLMAALRRELEADEIDVDLELIRQIPEHLRRNGWAARCTLLRYRGRWRLLGLADPEGPPPLGAALDLGTTRLVLRLVDLATGEHLAERAFDNPQAELGPDILTRIHHAAEPGGLEELRGKVAGEIRRELCALCRERDRPATDVTLVSVAGNTAMTHLFLGLEPRWIIREPYIPALNRPGALRARDLGLELAPGAGVFVFPNIGSYFGGDLIAGILHAGLHRRNAPAILVDVGTNAEVVIGGQDWLLGCAGAAGPALEGGAATMGMTAGPGAIDRVGLDETTGELRIHTMGGEPPRGICGSGLIDLAAALFRSGRIDIQGRLTREGAGASLRERDGVRELVVVPAERSGTGEDLCLSQPELDSLVRSKAAMFTILETIAAAVGLRPDDFETFYVAGTFGSLIDPRSAITIGMLPDLPLETFTVLGNSSLGGATKVLTDPASLDELDAIRDNITYLELNVNQDFMNRFSAAKFIPHTDPERFPSVRGPG